MGSILSKGIGSLVLKEYTDWNRIKNIAKRYGIYTAAGVAKLIVEHSPIKSVGEMKLQWAKRIYLAEQKNKDASLYSILKEDLEILEFLLGHDPLLIDWGSEWQKLLQKKKIKIDRKKLKKYSRIIEHHRKKYNEFLAKNKKFFTAWLDENKKDDEFDTFLNKIERAIKKKRY